MSSKAHGWINPPRRTPSTRSIRGRSSLQPMAHKQLRPQQLQFPLTAGSPWPSLPAPQPGYTCSSITVSWDGLQIKYSPTSALQTGSNTNRMTLLVGPGQLLNILFGPLYASGVPQHKAAQYIEQVLAQGVTFEGGHSYQFVGSSAGQLRERTAVMLRCSSPDEAMNLLNTWGNFGAIGNNVAKLYKRIGLLFSAVEAIELQGQQREIRHVVIDDIERNGYTFTDGCGIISHNMAVRVMAAKGKLRVHGTHYLPSAYQIRYRGFKGMFHIDTPDGAYMAAAAAAVGAPPISYDSCDLLLLFASPCSKSRHVSDSTFGLVATSQPYCHGYVNKQFIMLLSELGVLDEVLLAKQQLHFEELQGLLSDAGVAIRYLLANDKFDEAEALASCPDNTPWPPAVVQALKAIRSQENKGCYNTGQQHRNQAPQSSTPPLHHATNNTALAPLATAANTPAPQADVAPRLDLPRPTTAAAASAAPAAAPGARQRGSRPRPAVTSGGVPKATAGRAAAPTAPEAAGPPGSNSTASYGDRDCDCDVERSVVARLRFREPCSRLVFGIPDPTGHLQQGQALLDAEATVLRGCALVGRSPSYHPGDLRVLELVDVKGLRHLKDVLVFPVQGNRPHADECSGGDYDGDIFFVCWDQDLIPAAEVMDKWQPEDYSGPARECVNAGRADHAALVHYFAYYDPNLLGRLDSYYQYWAELNGVSCRQCVVLNKLFSRGVDSVKSGVKAAIPPHLKPPPRLPPVAADTTAATTTAAVGQPKRIWLQLFEQACTFVSAWQQHALAGDGGISLADVTCGLSHEELLELMDSRDVAVGEYGLFRLALSWWQQHGRAAPGGIGGTMELEHLVSCLDFGIMTAEQRDVAVAAGVPHSMGFNDLNRSQLLSGAQIKELGALGTSRRWRLYCEDLLTYRAQFAHMRRVSNRPNPMDNWDESFRDELNHGWDSFLQLDLANSTHRTYGHQQEQYKAFCCFMRRQEAPDAHTLAQFVIARARQGYALSTIEQGVHAVQRWGADLGMVSLAADPPSPANAN